MKNLFRLTLAVVVLLTACTRHREGKVWRDVKAQCLQDTTVRQLILVKCTEGSRAEVEFYLRNGQAWRLAASGPACIGKEGLGKEREGDMKTPEGEFGIRTAFGILPNPGTVMPYLPITPELYACSDDCEYYNQIVPAAALGHECKGEHLVKCVPHYNYGMEMNYNAENIYPLGSAVFFHCYGTNDYTEGCVAVEESFMKRILQESDEHLVVSIHRK